MKPSLNEYRRLREQLSAMWKSMSELEQKHIAQYKANSLDPELDAQYRRAEKEYYDLEKRCDEYSALGEAHGVFEADQESRC